MSGALEALLVQLQQATGQGIEDTLSEIDLFIGKVTTDQWPVILPLILKRGSGAVSLLQWVVGAARLSGAHLERGKALRKVADLMEVQAICDLLPFAEAVFTTCQNLLLTESHARVRMEAFKPMRLLLSKCSPVSPALKDHVVREVATGGLVERLVRVTKEAKQGGHTVQGGVAALLGVLVEDGYVRDTDSVRRRTVFGALATLFAREVEDNFQHASLGEGVIEGLAGVVAVMDLDAEAEPAVVQKVWLGIRKALFPPEGISRYAVPVAAADFVRKCAWNLQNLVTIDALELHRGLLRLCDESTFQTQTLREAAQPALDMVISVVALVISNADGHESLFETLLSEFVAGLRGSSSSSTTTTTTTTTGSGSRLPSARVQASLSIRALGKFAAPIRKYRSQGELECLFNEMLFRADSIFADFDGSSFAENMLPGYLDAFAGFVSQLDTTSVNASVVRSLEKLVVSIFQIFPQAFPKNKARLSSGLAQLLVALSRLGTTLHDLLQTAIYQGLLVTLASPTVDSNRGLEAMLPLWVSAVRSAQASAKDGATKAVVPALVEAYEATDLAVYGHIMEAVMKVAHKLDLSVADQAAERKRLEEAEGSRRKAMQERSPSMGLTPSIGAHSLCQLDDDSQYTLALVPDQMNSGYHEGTTMQIPLAAPSSDPSNDDEAARAAQAAGLNYVNRQDGELFGRLAEFLDLLLPAARPEFLGLWAERLVQTLISTAHRFPHEPGCLRILTAMTLVLDSTGFFDGEQPIEDEEETTTSSSLRRAQCTSDLFKSAERCTAQIEKFVRVVAVRSQSLEDDLLAAALEFATSMPSALIHRLGGALFEGPLLVGLRIGLSYPTLAFLCISAIERWWHGATETVRPLLPKILPLLGDYLFRTSAASSDGDTSGAAPDGAEDDEVFGGRKNRLMMKTGGAGVRATKFVAKSVASLKNAAAKRRAARKRADKVISETGTVKDSFTAEEEEVESLASIQRRIMRLLGTLGALGDGLLGEVDAKSGMTWDTTKRLPFQVEFPDCTVDVALDDFLPRAVALALGASDRRTKVAACEFLHSVVVLIVGTNAETVRSSRPQAPPAGGGGGGGAPPPSRSAGSSEPAAQQQLPPKTAMFEMYRHLVPVILQLATDPDPFIRQVFEPLVLQVIHWLTGDVDNEGREAGVFLDAVLEALAQGGNSALRKFSAKCTMEFIVWSFKRLKFNDPTSPWSASMLIHRLRPMFYHADPFRRFGACLIVEKMYPVMQVSGQAGFVARWVLDLAVSCLAALRISAGDDPALESGDQARRALLKLAKIIIFRAGNLPAVPEEQWLVSSSEERGDGPCNSIYTFLSHLLDEISSTDVEQYRQACMWLFSNLIWQTRGIGEPTFILGTRLRVGSSPAIDALPLVCEGSLGTETLTPAQAVARGASGFAWIFDDRLLPSDELLAVIEKKTKLLPNLSAVVKAFLDSFSGADGGTQTKGRTAAPQPLDVQLALGAAMRCASAALELYFGFHTDNGAAPAALTRLLDGGKLVLCAFWVAVCPWACGVSSDTPIEVGMDHTGKRNLVPLSGVAVTLLKALKPLATYSKILDSVVVVFAKDPRSNLVGALVSRSEPDFDPKRLTDLVTGYRSLVEIGLVREKAKEALAKPLFEAVFEWGQEVMAPAVKHVASQVLDLSFAMGLKVEVLCQRLVDSSSSAPSSAPSRDGGSDQQQPNKRARTMAAAARSATTASDLTFAGDVFYNLFRDVVRPFVAAHFEEASALLLGTYEKQSTVFDLLVSSLRVLGASAEADRAGFTLPAPLVAHTASLKARFEAAGARDVAKIRTLLHVLDAILRVSASSLLCPGSPALQDTVDILVRALGHEDRSVKWHALEVVHHVAGLPAAAFRPVKLALDSIALSFPARFGNDEDGAVTLSGGPVPAAERLISSSLLRKMLRAVGRCEGATGIAILEPLLPVFNDPTGWVGAALSRALSTFLVRVASTEDALACWRFCLDFATDRSLYNHPMLRLAMIERIALPLLARHSANPATILTLFLSPAGVDGKSGPPALSLLVGHGAGILYAEDHTNVNTLVSITAAARLVEALFLYVDYDIIKDKCNLVFLDSMPPDRRPDEPKGTELTRKLMETFKALKALDPDPKPTPQRTAMHHAVYACMGAILLRSQRNAKSADIFTRYLLEDDVDVGGNGLRSFWANLVNLDERYEFQPEQQVNPKLWAQGIGSSAHIAAKRAAGLNTAFGINYRAEPTTGSTHIALASTAIFQGSSLSSEVESMQAFTSDPRAAAKALVVFEGYDGEVKPDGSGNDLSSAGGDEDNNKNNDEDGDAFMLATDSSQSSSSSSSSSSSASSLTRVVMRNPWAISQDPSSSTTTSGDNFDPVGQIMQDPDVINSNPAMETALRALDHVTRRFPLDPAGPMPDWMQAMCDIFTRADNPLPLLLFLAKIVINRMDIFRPFAARWASPMARLLLLPENGGTGFHYFVRDICILLVSWGQPLPPGEVAAPALGRFPPAFPSSDLRIRVLDFTMTRCPYEKAKIQLSNLLIVRGMLDIWKATTPLPDRNCLVSLFRKPQGMVSNALAVGQIMCAAALVGFCLQHPEPPLDRELLLCLLREGLEAAISPDVVREASRALGIALRVLSTQVNLNEQRGNRERVEELAAVRTELRSRGYAKLVELAAKNPALFLSAADHCSEHFSGILGSQTERQVQSQLLLVLKLPALSPDARSSGLRCLTRLVGEPWYASASKDLFRELLPLMESSKISIVTRRETETQLEALALIDRMTHGKDLLTLDQVVHAVTLFADGLAVSREEVCRTKLYDFLFRVHDHLVSAIADKVADAKRRDREEEMERDMDRYRQQDLQQQQKPLGALALANSVADLESALSTVRASLLKGLTDPSEAIRNRCYDEWDLAGKTRLARDEAVHRLRQLFSDLYDPRVEPEWVHYAVHLLLRLLPDRYLRSKLFKGPLFSNAKFDEIDTKRLADTRHTLGTGGRGASLVGASQGLYIPEGFVRATQMSGVDTFSFTFDPGQNPTKDPLSMPIFGEPEGDVGSGAAAAGNGAGAGAGAGAGVGEAPFGGDALVANAPSYIFDVHTAMLIDDDQGAAIPRPGTTLFAHPGLATSSQMAAGSTALRRLAAAAPATAGGGGGAGPLMPPPPPPGAMGPPQNAAAAKATAFASSRSYHKPLRFRRGEDSSSRSVKNFSYDNVRVIAERNRQKEKQERARKQAKSDKVILYRKYRVGEMPDVEIPRSAIVFPLQALCLFDNVTARLVFVSLFRAIEGAMRKVDESTFAAVDEGIVSVLAASNRNDPGFAECLLAICPASVPAADVVRVAKNSFNQHAGIKALEDRVLASGLFSSSSADHAHLGDKMAAGMAAAPRPAAASRPRRLTTVLAGTLDVAAASSGRGGDAHDLEALSGLAELYGSLGEAHVRRSLQERYLCRGPELAAALKAEASGNVARAAREFRHVTKTAEGDAGDKALARRALLECTEKMSMWGFISEALPCDGIALCELPDWQWALPLGIRAHLKHRVMTNFEAVAHPNGGAVERDASPLAAALAAARAYSEAASNHIVGTLAVEEGVVQLLQGNHAEALRSVQGAYDRFLEVWLALHPLSRSSRLSLVRGLGRLAELEEAARVMASSATSSAANDSGVACAALAARWASRAPAVDTTAALHWDDLTHNRIAFLMKLRGRGWDTDADKLLILGARGLRKCGRINAAEAINRLLMSCERPINASYDAAKLSIKLRVRKGLTLMAAGDMLPEAFEEDMTRLAGDLAKHRDLYAMDSGPGQLGLYALLRARVLARVRATPAAETVQCFEEAARLLHGCPGAAARNAGNKAHLELARFLDQRLATDTSSSSSSPATEPLRLALVKSALVALSGGLKGATDLIPRVLALGASSPSESSPVMKALAEGLPALPSWLFIPWCGHLFVDARRADSIPAHLRRLLATVAERLAAEYPQAVYLPLRMAVESAGAGEDPAALQAILSKVTASPFGEAMEALIEAVEDLCNWEIAVKDAVKYVNTELGNAAKRPAGGGGSASAAALLSALRGLWRLVSPRSGDAALRGRQVAGLFAFASGRAPAVAAHKALHTALNEIAAQLDSLLDAKGANRTRLADFVKASTTAASGSGSGSASSAAFDLRPKMAALHAAVREIDPRFRLGGWVPNAGGSLALETYSRRVGRVLAAHHGVLELPGQYTGLGKPDPASHRRIVGVSPFVLGLDSIRKPKRVGLFVDDLREYHFLAKQGEDIRQDERVETAFRLMNAVLQADPTCRDASLRLRTYDVFPMTTHTGLLGWVPDTSTFKSMIFGAVGDQGYKAASAQYSGYIESCAGSGRKAAGAGPHAGYAASYAADDAAVAANFEVVCSMMPANALRGAVMRLCATPAAYISVRERFMATLAAFSAGSYVMGIGDRHSDNLLIDTTSGDVVGIDFGHAFGTATFLLPVPELVPFRFTRQVSSFLSPLDTTGLFRLALTQALTCLSEPANRARLLSLLEVFITDPTEDWETYSSRTMEPAAAYARNRLDLARAKLSRGNPIEVLSRDLDASRTMVSVDPTKKVLGDIKAAIKRKRPAGPVLPSVEAQVDTLISLATDPAILGRSWAGWGPFM